MDVYECMYCIWMYVLYKLMNMITCVCMYVCMYVCTYLCMYGFYLCMYT